MKSAIAAVIAVATMTIAGDAGAACATQPAALVATGGKLSICGDEATTGIEIERNGVVQPILPIVLAPGVAVDLAGYVQCALGVLRVRGVNAAGAGPWGAAVPATFPGCVAPKLGNPLP